ncbi:MULTISPECIES: hypothetical protein, partial [unclassified Microcoleus]|uniref:hypothetical protein n=1 Tax=unclassified Microcoleus TaxID=2642155 RepID=UPI001D7B0086
RSRQEIISFPVKSSNSRILPVRASPLATGDNIVSGGIGIIYQYGLLNAFLEILSDDFLGNTGIFCKSDSS